MQSIIFGDKTMKRKIISWKYREHLFTPANITKLEFASLKEKVYPSPCNIKIKVRALSHGPVKYLGGVFKLLTTEEQFFEDLLMSKGPQLPEDRSGEPDQFYLFE